jgi:hypothetical protein
MMKKIIHVSIYDDVLGECDAMFDENGSILGAWSKNDADWRQEYMNPFMRKLGIEVVSATEKETEEFIPKIIKFFGL